MTYLRVFSMFVVFWCVSQAGKAVAQDWIYHAQPGDTLWDLCIEHTARRGCFKELASYNNMTEQNRVYPGDEIRIPIAWLVALPIVGKVVNVQGEVYYQPQSGANVIPLREGQNLVLGGSISCKSGSARITLGNHSEMLIRRDSVLELSNMSVGNSQGQAAELQLNKGEVEVKVKPNSRSRFEIHTPSAIAAVRGTKYRVVSQAGTRSEVLSGKVAVQAETEVDVPAGFGVKAQKGKVLGDLRKLLDAPIFAEPSVQSTLPIHVHWLGNPGAIAWQLDLYAEGEAGALLISTHSTTPEIQYQQLAQGCYRLVARGIDEDGFNGLESQLPVCVHAPAPEPEPETNWALILWLAMAALILI